MSSRTPRPKKARGRSMVGQRFTATVGPVAHGGHCIVRLPDPENRVVFTRHTLPGERVVLEITEGTEGDSFWRADAVEILDASRKRVPAPCPYAGPRLCGGCDFQHVRIGEQRRLKAAVVEEQLSRLANIERSVTVEEVPGDDNGLRWRTRVQFATGPDGQRGMRAHRSRTVIPVDDCLIARPDARLVGEASGTGPVTEHVRDRAFLVEADGFWQVHPGAPTTLVDTVLEFLAPQPGEKALDLYAGVGLFASFLGEAVGDGGSVIAIEADRRACAHATSNVRDLRRVTVAQGQVDQVLTRLDDPPADIVVLDPPREGARRKVVEKIVSCAPRAVAYIACDPAALARDVAIFAEHGYELTGLRALDLFPMTHHVECVALLTR